MSPARVTFGFFVGLAILSYPAVLVLFWWWPEVLLNPWFDLFFSIPALVLMGFLLVRFSREPRTKGPEVLGPVMRITNLVLAVLVFSAVLYLSFIAPLPRWREAAIVFGLLTPCIFFAGVFSSFSRSRRDAYLCFALALMTNLHFLFNLKHYEQDLRFFARFGSPTETRTYGVLPRWEAP